MRERDKGHGEYVRKVQEGTHRYAHRLLAENEKLRARVAQLETERDVLLDKSRHLDAVAEANASLRAENHALLREREALVEEASALRDRIEREERRYLDVAARLDDLAQENRRFADEYLAVEQQNSNLANLYVASYRLHGTVDRHEVVAAIQEIIANLVGSEELAILERTDDGHVLSLVASCGIDPAPLRSVRVGDGIIGRAAETGQTFIAAPEGAAGRTAEEEALTACVPLTAGGRVVGVLAMFRLLSHKPALEAVDRELFDLLASQAGVALYCARLHAAGLAANGSSER